MKEEAIEHRKLSGDTKQRMYTKKVTSRSFLRDALHAVTPDSPRIQMMKNYYTLCVSARKRAPKKLTPKVFKMQLFAMMFLAAPHGLFTFLLLWCCSESSRLFSHCQ